MMGGHIHRSGKTGEKVLVRHTEEVVCGANGVVPKPKHHLTGIEMTPASLPNYPIQVINLTTGTRTQLVGTEGGTASDYTAATIDGTQAIQFKNPSLIDTNGNVQTTEQGDRIRLFWVEEVTPNTSDRDAIEVTISPETLNDQVRSLKVTNCWKLLSYRTISSEGMQMQRSTTIYP